MGRRKKSSTVEQSKFVRTPEMVIDGFTIIKGEVIKIKGEHGSKFRFANLVTNTENGRTWVDCYELYNGLPGGTRAFELERVKRIPKKRVKKNVN